MQSLNYGKIVKPFFFFKVKVIVYTVLFGEGMKILVQILTVHVQTVWLVVYCQVFSDFYHLVSPQFARALDPVFFPHETSSFCFLGFFFFFNLSGCIGS